MSCIDGMAWEGNVGNMPLHSQREGDQGSGFLEKSLGGLGGLGGLGDLGDLGNLGYEESFEFYHPPSLSLSIIK
jgi:hypothetical protein